jgi:polyhydroxybutyrate depolymerase
MHPAPTPAPAPSSAARRRGARRRAGAALILAASLLAACSSGGSSDGAGSDAAGDEITTTTEAPAEVTTTTIDPDEVAALLEERPIDVHVPPGYRDGEPAPLLVLLHGFGATGEVQELYFGLTPAADDAGMLYVQPDGTKNAIDRQFWNASDACCAGPLAEDVDDSTYLRAVIADVSDRYAVDPDRIFLVGHSNGGFMSFRMACDHADVVAAIVSIAGATTADADACAPSEPVSTLQIHGVEDDTIRYEGGSTTFGEYPSAEETAELWVGRNGCDPVRVSDPQPAERDLVVGQPPAEVAEWTGCDDDVAVELWTQPGGVHIPPWSDTFAQQVIDWLVAHPNA